MFMECSWCTQDGLVWFTRIILLKVHITLHNMAITVSYVRNIWDIPMLSDLHVIARLS